MASNYGYGEEDSELEEISVAGSAAGAGSHALTGLGSFRRTSIRELAMSSIDKLLIQGSKLLAIAIANTPYYYYLMRHCN